MKALRLPLLAILFTLLSCEDNSISPGDTLATSATSNALVNQENTLTPELKLELRINTLGHVLQTGMQPDIKALEKIGEIQLRKYGVDVDQLFPDPNDPRRSLVAIVVKHLEEIYAAGYEVAFVDDPTVPIIPEATDGWDCLLKAVGIDAVVKLLQSGAGAAGLTGDILVGTFMRMSVRYGLGVVGVMVAAYILGDCLASIPTREYEEAEGFDPTDPNFNKKINNAIAFREENILKVAQFFKDQYGADTLSMTINNTYLWKQ